MPQLPVRCVGDMLGGGLPRRGGCWCWVIAAAVACTCPGSADNLPLPLCPTCRLNVDLANNFLPSRPASMPAYNLAMPPPQPALNAPGMVPV